ncbi:MAG: rhodanese-like domain-containing protein [Thermoanaerobaculia bacterium]
MKPRLLAVAVAVAAAAVLCLGCATSRRVVASLTANCKEVQPGVAFEMMRDNPNILSLDVRHAGEITEARPRIPRSRNVPLSELPRRFRELRPWQKQTIVIFSRDGADAASACEFLARQGFLYVSHVSGGVEAWSRRGFLRAPSAGSE